MVNHGGPVFSLTFVISHEFVTAAATDGFAPTSWFSPPVSSLFGRHRNGLRGAAQGRRY